MERHQVLLIYTWICFRCLERAKTYSPKWWLKSKYIPQTIQVSCLFKKGPSSLKVQEEISTEKKRLVWGPQLRSLLEMDCSHMWQPCTGWFLLLMVSKKSSYSPHRWPKLNCLVLQVFRLPWKDGREDMSFWKKTQTCFPNCIKLRCKSQSLLLNTNSWTSQTLEKSGRANCQHQPSICQH